MIKKEENTAGKQRQRRLLIGSGLMLAVAAGIFVTLHRTQQNAVQSVLPRVKEAPRITAREKAQSVERAKVLREKWRVWAEQHKGELTRMLQAKPGDQTAFVGVWDALPTAPAAQAGITQEDLTPNGVQPPSPVGFGWAPFDKVRIGSSLKSEVQQVMLAGQKAGGEVRQIEFARNRDIVLASSMVHGTRVHLWASGRVTETTMLPARQKPAILRRVRAEKRDFTILDMQSPHQQIAPPYEFLPQTPLNGE